MASDLNQEEYCKKCRKTYPNWDAYLLHKIQSNRHIACLFCGQDFNTLEGRNRHQFQVCPLPFQVCGGDVKCQQYHAAEQDLKCAGCGIDFVRVGSYISHIEQKQCPVIHKSLFEARRAAKEAALKEKKYGDSLRSYPNTAPSTVGPDSLSFEDNGPIQTSWDMWADNDRSTELNEEDFPTLTVQNTKEGNAKIPDHSIGQPSKLNKENLDWLAQRELFPYLPPQPTLMPQKSLAAVVTDPVTKEEQIHPWDPDNPNFNAQEFYNPYSDKYRCPWPGCKKLQNSRFGLIQHLKSPAHMNAKLRCPGCLRQYGTATALVQHAESQAIKCQIRESDEYKSAIDQLTGGFVDTAGRHEDHTVRYIAPVTDLSENSVFQSQNANINATLWEEQEQKQKQNNEGPSDENRW